MIGSVKEFNSEVQFHSFKKSLPIEAYEALCFFVGDNPLTVDEVIEEYSDNQNQSVDTSDYSAALERPSSRRSFYVIDDEDELGVILEDSLERWRIFLHPSQRKLVNRQWNGPVRVLGGAGTGKTVVAMHRAKWLAEHLSKPNDSNKNSKILFTTHCR